MLTNSSDVYHIRILEFTDQDEWDVKISLLLPQNSCGYVPSPNGYIFSLAFFDDLGGSTERFYVFLGYGPESGVTGQNKIWYFVFDLDNSDYRYLRCGEFANTLDGNGFATQYFRQLTLAPEDGDGICRLVVGYKQEFESDPVNVWKSGFRVGYLTQVAQLPLNRLSFNRYDPDDYKVVLQVLLPLPVYFPKPIQYMGVIARDTRYDLVILTVGFVTPDDVLFVHELGDKDNLLRTSSGRYCASLLDHPLYFAKMQITEDNSTETNIAIVRGSVLPSGSKSFVRYTAEPDPETNVFSNYKLLLESPVSPVSPVSPGPPDIPAKCKLFHMDSGDMTGDGNDDLAVIWKECPEYCELGEYVLEITGISEKPIAAGCEDINFEHSFADGFAEGDDIDDLVEPMYIRYTAKDGGYFLSLFYHDDEDDGISVHVHVYTFSS